MKRRFFLATVLAAIGGVALPTVARAVPPQVMHGGFVFIGPEFFDFGHQTGLAMRLPDERMIAVRMRNAKPCHPGDSLPPEDLKRLKLALLERAREMV